MFWYLLSNDWNFYKWLVLLLLITGDDDDNDDDCDEVLSSDYWCHCRWQMPENYPDYGKMMFLAHLSTVLKVSYCDRPLSVIYLCVCLSVGNFCFKWRLLQNRWTEFKIISQAQLDALSDWSPGGRGFNPRRGQQHSFMEIDHEIFLRSFSPIRWFKKGSCQFLAKECAQYWLTA